MNMVFRKGDFVGYVPVARLEVPLPQRWYLRQCTPGKDARVIERLSMLGVCAWSPTIVRFIDRRTGKVAAKQHLGRRVESPFLPGLIFVPDFEIDNPLMRARDVVDNLGEMLRVTVSGGGHVVMMHDQPVLRDQYQFASMSARLMAELREILEAENATRFGSRGRRGPARYKPGDKVYVVDGDSPLFAFEAEIKRGVDSRGRLKAFIAALMGGVSVTLSEAQVEPA